MNPFVAEGVKQGQVWLCKDQSIRGKITRVHLDKFFVRYINRGIPAGEAECSRRQPFTGWWAPVNAVDGELRHVIFEPEGVE